MPHIMHQPAPLQRVRQNLAVGANVPFDGHRTMNTDGILAPRQQFVHASPSYVRLPPSTQYEEPHRASQPSQSYTDTPNVYRTTPETEVSRRGLPPLRSVNAAGGHASPIVHGHHDAQVRRPSSQAGSTSDVRYASHPQAQSPPGPL